MSNMKQAAQIGLLVAGFLAVGTVYADTPARQASLDFASLDANSDGRISASEVQFVDDLRAEFPNLDANGDEELTPAEFGKWDRAASSSATAPADPSTGPSGSSGAQHMPEAD